ncbi:RNA polymerase sigma factor [Chitinophaga varians]|uniref:RNA polymerase sigma factor n=1 Tax=Chitinophaga varians TaxID=2202339 RepID=UPI00165F1001|nr:RNA polymerase sigma factor [Chitinophaga varians]MBC9914945.1 RNA polymerase sigma factor [Chitinophaga varians]
MQYDRDMEKGMLLEVSEGNQQAFTALVKTYRRYVYTAALKLLHQPPLAEEVVQDVFLKVWLNRTVLPEVEHFSAWLLGVARNTIYTAFRRSLKDKLVPVGIPDDVLPANDNTEDPLLNKEYTALLEKAIARLPLRQQQTYRLIRQEGHKRTEAAAIMGVSPETVKFNLDEANRKVRAYCLAQLPLGALLLLLNIK